jgi:hypothetical protein
MKNDSYGMSLELCFVGLSSFIIFSIVPYSCRLLSICCAKAD